MLVVVHESCSFLKRLEKVLVYVIMFMLLSVGLSSTAGCLAYNNFALKINIALVLKKQKQAEDLNPIPTCQVSEISPAPSSISIIYDRHIPFLSWLAVRIRCRFDHCGPVLGDNGPIGSSETPSYLLLSFI